MFSIRQKNTQKKFFQANSGALQWTGSDIEMSTMINNANIEWHCSNCMKKHISAFSEVYQLTEGLGKGDFVLNCKEKKELPPGNRITVHDVFIDRRRVPKPILPILEKASKKYPSK